MFEINAEIINGSVYVSTKDLIHICRASLSKGLNTPFDRALKQLESELMGIEKEALESVQLTDETTSSDSVRSCP